VDKTGGWFNIPVMLKRSGEKVLVILNPLLPL